jgi:flagellar protein FliS
MRSSASSVAAYQSVAAHGGVAGADPHRLVVMLLDGALERIAVARGAIQRGSKAEKASAVHRAVSIVDELRNSLNLEAGGAIAANLDDLYDYACRQLLRASVSSRSDLLDEVAALLGEIRGAWLALSPEVRNLQAATR